MPNTTTLRAHLDSGKMLVAPGAIDAITAREIERAGFPAVYMTGAGTSMSLGYPDYGLVTMTEMVANASRIANAISVPLISDADTGYGNELNVFRTVQEFERAGVAGIHIEDQVFPKRCGHLDSKEVTSVEDYIAKIRAAAAARRTRDFIIIARTDSRAVLGFDEAISRARLALANGADVVFVEAPQSLEEVASVPKLVGGPCLLNMVRGGKSPDIALADAAAMGFAISIMPGLLLQGIIAACEDILEAVKREGRAPVPKRETSPAKTFARFNAAEWDARRSAFRGPLSPSVEAQPVSAAK